MSKTRSLLAGLKAAISSPPDWPSRVAAAQAELDEALQAHGRAALGSQQELPGAGERLLLAINQLNAARTKVETVQAAQRAWEAQEAERQASVATAEAERQDKAAQAAFDHLATVAKEGDAILPALDAWWRKMLAADVECRKHLATNPRLRSDLQHYSLPGLAAREIARVSTTTPPPPGADQLAATLGDRAAWEPLSAFFAGVAASVLPNRPNPKTKAA